jgi:hypothetical protein
VGLRRLLALDNNGTSKLDTQGALFGNTNTAADGFSNLQSIAQAGIRLKTYSNNNAEFGKSTVT